MKRLHLAALVLLAGCTASSRPAYLKGTPAGYEPHEYIPLVSIAPLETTRTVRLLVVDRRLPGLFTVSQPETVVTNDVQLLVANRVAYELAFNGVKVGLEGDEVRVELLDFCWNWSQQQWMTFDITTAMRLRLSVWSNHHEVWGVWVTGMGTGVAAGAQSLPIIADELERVINEAMKSAHEHGYFVAIRDGASPR